MTNSIPKQVIKGLGDLSRETGEKLVSEVGKIGSGIITGRELLGGIHEMSDVELQQKKHEEEQNKQKEIEDLRKEMGLGRNLEQEMQQLRYERDNQEQQEERQEEMAENREKQEEMMSQSYTPEPSSKPKRGQGVKKGKHGKASQADMSATQEYFKKND